MCREGRIRLMPGLQDRERARIICRGYGFLHNLNAGFYDLGGTVMAATQPRVARDRQSWDAVASMLRMA